MRTGLLGTSQSLWSSTYMIQASWSCLRLFKQTMAWALALARDSAGRSSAARIAMMAMTTRSSTRVKPLFDPLLTPPCRVKSVGFKFIESLGPKIAHIVPEVSETLKAGFQLGRDWVPLSLPHRQAGSLSFFICPTKRRLKPSGGPAYFERDHG